MFKGVYPAVVTPFHPEGGSLNLDAFTKHIEWLVKSGVDGLVIMGSTGEAPFLTREERVSLLKTARERLGDNVKIIAGTGAQSLKETLVYSRDAEKVGVDALLVITPYYYRHSQERLIEYYRELAGRVDTPILLYSFPQMAGVRIEPTTVDKLIDGEKIVGIKDSSGDMQAFIEMIRLVNERGSLITGSAKLSIPTLVMGGSGLILSLANLLPNTFSKIYKYVIGGDLDKALELYWMMYPVLEAVERGNIPVIKYLLNKMGFNIGPPRTPLKLPSSVDDENRLLQIISKMENI